MQDSFFTLCISGLFILIWACYQIIRKYLRVLFFLGIAASVVIFLGLRSSVPLVERFCISTVCGFGAFYLIIIILALDNHKDKDDFKKLIKENYIKVYDADGRDNVFRFFSWHSQRCTKCDKESLTLDEAFKLSQNCHFDAVANEKKNVLLKTGKKGKILMRCWKGFSTPVADELWVVQQKKNTYSLLLFVRPKRTMKWVKI